MGCFYEKSGIPQKNLRAAFYSSSQLEGHELPLATPYAPHPQHQPDWDAPPLTLVDPPVFPSVREVVRGSAQFSLVGCQNQIALTGNESGASPKR